jgi:hypothetical protein
MLGLNHSFLQVLERIFEVVLGLKDPITRTRQDLSLKLYPNRMVQWDSFTGRDNARLATPLRRACGCDKYSALLFYIYFSYIYCRSLSSDPS